jgi:magnesium transporter
MEQHEITQEAPVAVQEPFDAEQMAATLQQLIEDGHVAEAIVRLSRLRSPDQADVMTRLSSESQTVLLSLLPPEDVGTILEEMEPEQAVEVSQSLEPEQLSQVLDQTSPDVAADVLRGLPEEIAATALQNMEEAQEVAPLLEYEDDDAGGLMTSSFVALRENMTVMQAMSFIRQWAEEMEPDHDGINYLFVVDRGDMLKGGLSLARLVLARLNQRISLIMDADVLSVLADTDQEEAARLMERYNVANLPVVDESGKLVGVLYWDDMMDVLDEEATEDMYRMIGVDEEEKALGPFWRSVRSRLPWLFVNLATAMLAGYVVSIFQSTMAQAVALAAFLPVIAGQGGIAGTQTLTLIVRSMALGEVSPNNAKRLLLKETGLGLVHGLALGLLVGLIALVWQGSEYLALVVGVAMVANLIVAGISGVIVPLGFKALRIDPALSSAVAVTTATDVLGFLAYLGLATLTIGLILRSL